MPKCSYPGCENNGLLYKCRLCGEKFCGEHRLPEFHNCPKLSFYQSEEYRKAKTRLYLTAKQEKTVQRSAYQVVELPRKGQKSLFEPYTTGNPKKDVLISIGLAWLVFGVVELLIFYSTPKRPLTYIIALTMPLALATLTVISKIKFVETKTRKKGVSYTYLHTVFGIIATLITNIIPLFFFKWVTIGTVVFTKTPLTKKEKGRLAMSIITFTTAMGYLFQVLRQATITLWNPSTGAEYLITIVRSLDLATIGIMYITLFSAIPFNYGIGDTTGRALLDWGLKWVVIAIALPITGILYLWFIPKNIIIPLILATSLFIYSFIEK